jgi:hypothetical protein
VLRQEFDYRSKEILLQEIAFYLKGKGEIVSMNEILLFVITFFKNRGLDFEANVILEKLISSGILAHEAGAVTFRYRCFQEYFLAKRLNENDEQLESILNGPELLLYAREIDLLTGLSRTQGRVVSILYDKLTELKPTWLKDVTLDDFDRIKLQTPATELVKRVAQMRTKRLSSDEIDDFVEYTEKRFQEQATDPSLDAKVARMETPAQGEATPPQIFFQLLNLFGKATRNSEFISTDEKERAVNLFYTSFGAAILLWIRIGDRIAQDVREGKASVATLSTSNPSLLEYVMKTILFVMFSIVADDAIASPKLRPIFVEIMNKKNTPTIIKILCAFTLLDNEHKEWQKHFAALLKEIKDNPYVVKILAERLYIYYRTTVLNAAERLEFEQFIADLEIALGASRRAKGRIMQEMRTSRAQAELRQS